MRSSRSIVPGGFGERDGGTRYPPGPSGGIDKGGNTGDGRFGGRGDGGSSGGGDGRKGGGGARGGGGSSHSLHIMWGTWSTFPTIEVVWVAVAETVEEHVDRSKITEDKVNIGIRGKQAMVFDECSRGIGGIANRKKKN